MISTENIEPPKSTSCQHFFNRRGGQLESTELLIVEDSDIVNGNNKHENANNENRKSRNDQREESLSNSSSDGSSEESGSREKIGSGEKYRSGEKNGSGEKYRSGEKIGSVEESGLKPKLYGSILKHPGKVRRRGMIKHVEFLDKLVEQEAQQELHTRDF